MVDDTKKVSWNASQGLIMELSNRRSYSNTFFVNGDIRKAFNTLVAIKQSVIQSFSDKERKKLQGIEDKFNRFSAYLYSTSANSWNKKIRDAYLLSKKISCKVYAEYNETLMDLLEKYGYLIGEQTDSSRMKF